jgi:hypothetical protein
MGELVAFFVGLVTDNLGESQLVPTTPPFVPLPTHFIPSRLTVQAPSA